MPDYEVLGDLPEHRLPTDGPIRQISLVDLDGALHVFAPSDLMLLPQTTLTEDFVCEEGWSVPRQSWSGVLVEDLLSTAGIAQAEWVEFAAGDYRFTRPMTEARSELIALMLNGAPISEVHGGPFRLYVPGEACHTSIKWLDRIEVRHLPGLDTASQIAGQRLMAREGR